MMINPTKATIEQCEDSLDIRDAVYGVVTGNCSKGLFLELENGQQAFSHFGGLAPGSEVLCSVIKKATEKWRVLVSIDSVLTEAIVAA